MDQNISVANQTCIIATYRGFLVHGSFPFAVCIILILSFIQRTKKERQPGALQNPLRDLFSLIYPIDLFDNHDRLPHCLAFGAASSMVLDLIFGDYQSYFFGWVMPGWSKILFGTIVTIEIAVDCFPFFACITCKSRLIANGMGFLYLAGWFIMLILISVGCESRGHENKEPYPVLVPQIPVLICIFLLTIYFLGMFISILIQRHKGITLTSQERLYKTHQAIYVRNLLNKPAEVVYTGWRARFVKFYKPHPGFIYPTRVLMPCFVCIISIYQVAFWFIPLGLNLINLAYGTLMGLAAQHYNLLNDTETLANITAQVNQAHTGLRVSWWIASILSIIVALLYTPHILKNYRKHLMSMWAGKHKLQTAVTLKSADSIVGSLKYIGFQVAVFLTGYMVVQGFIFVLVAGITFIVLASMWYFQTFFISFVVDVIVPSTIISVLVMYSQNIIVKHCFTQAKLDPGDADVPLALKHSLRNVRGQPVHRERSQQPHSGHVLSPDGLRCPETKAAATETGPSSQPDGQRRTGQQPGTQLHGFGEHCDRERTTQSLEVLPLAPGLHADQQSLPDPAAEALSHLARAGGGDIPRWAGQVCQRRERERRASVAASHRGGDEAARPDKKQPGSISLSG
ncbi:stimulated by retinoic acid gene 6 protein-like isoform X2 [Patiria miniata]|uniref:Uncharacterized protein n=1 Tax=Patiria miniata TaxID=46514 RepID=A0A914BDH3_PATMI|nr:stimulated by retinoic acid gene 6 protein-like isoform X2 [Patiria miniata]